MARMNKIIQKLFAAMVIVHLCLMGCLTTYTFAAAKDIQNSQIIIATQLTDVSGSDIERVRKEAEKALNSIPPILGFEYKKKIQIEIVANGICRTTPDEHVIFLPLWHIKNKRAAIIHEVSHAIVRRHENNSFFSEGLAEFFQGEFGEDVAGVAYYKEPLHLSLDDLVIKHRADLISLSDLRNNNGFYTPIDPEIRKATNSDVKRFLLVFFSL